MTLQGGELGVEAGAQANFSAGATFTYGYLVIGNSGTSGVATFDHSVINAFDVLLSASSGAGTLTLRNGTTGYLFDVSMGPFGGAGNATVQVQSGSKVTFENLDDASSGTPGLTGSISVIGAGTTFSALSDSSTATIGAASGSSGMLAVDGGASFVQGSPYASTFVAATVGSTASTLTLNPTGVMTVTNGASVALGNLAQNGGTLTVAPGTAFGFIGDLTIGSGGLFGSNVTIGAGTSRALTGITTVAAGSTLTISGGEFSTGQLVNNGTINFIAGTLAITNQSLGIGIGRPLGTNFSLGVGQKLIVSKGVATSITGGNIAVFSGDVLSLSGGTLISDTFTDGGLMDVLASPTTGVFSTLTINGGGSITSIGTLRIRQDQVGVINGEVTNSGVIFLGVGATEAGYLAGSANLTNSGLISGSGELSKALINSSAGRLGAIDASGAYLRVTGGPVTNSGQINLTHGVLEFTFPLNNTIGGIISGAGNLNALGGLTNSGQMQFSAGDSVVHGAVTSVAGSRISVAAGANVTFYDSVALNSTTFQVSTGAAAVFYGPVTGNSNLTGSGTIDFESGHSPLANAVVNSASVEVQPAATVDVGVLRMSNFYLGGAVNVLPNGTSAATSVIGSLFPTGGRLDLANNDLVVQNTLVAAILPLVQSGYAGGAWSGQGIASSSAVANAGQGLGVISGAIFHLLNGSAALFDGMTVGDSDALVKYTYQGDADFSGTITLSDYALIDSAFYFHVASPGWVNGDFNYDGMVDYKDYALIDFAFTHQSGGPLAEGMISQHEAIFGAPYEEALAALSAPVPEPGALALLAVGAAGLLMRKRR